MVLCVARAQNLPEMEGFVAAALDSHPRIAESFHRLKRAESRYQEVYGFFDPALRLATGANDETRAIPGLSDLGSLSSEAYEIQGSLELPFRPGFFLSVGATERYLRDPDGYDNLYQSLAGIGIRIPLLQDRGFALWDLDHKIRLADYDSALSEYLDVRQRLRRDVEQAYITVCENLAVAQITREAANRNEALVREAEGLAEHQALAEYQVYAPRTEFALSKSEDLLARQLVQTSLLSLAELVSGEEPPDIPMDREKWLEQVSKLRLPDPSTPAESLRNRGDFLVLVNQRIRAQYAAEKEIESLRGDLSLQAMATWMAEDEDAPLGTTDPLDSDRTGGHVMLVYERPLGFRAEKSRLAQQRSLQAELAARCRQIELLVKRDLKRSYTRLEFAEKRLREAGLAVQFAKRNLTAEQERFTLGEARSRHVLDAQKDVTQAQRTQIAAAAGFLKALSDYDYAAGYPDRGGIHQPVDDLQLE